ncbi:MAG: hypothetical protein AB2765_04790 [Candidatus Thiodiazotropha endolucinida]
MTKIIFDPATYQAERHTGSPMDLARRLEWRLQWEKAHVDNWRTSRHEGMQQTDVTELPVDSSEGGLRIKHGAFTQSQLASNKMSDVKGQGDSDQLYRYQSKLRYDSPNQKEARFTTAFTVIAPAGDEGTGRPFFVTPKTPPTVRVTPMPLNRRSQPAVVHIYQVDGTVEVALRNTGLKGKSGVTLLIGLKRDLASFGLRLTRLILNGELLWQTETQSPKGLARTDTDADDMPIDKIY